MTAGIGIKRIYDPAAPADGARILVDRIWPRGISKEAAALALWLKDVAPSTELRQWFGHAPDRWPEFRQRYRAELDHAGEALAPLRALARQGAVTLLYAAQDRERNNAVVLAEYCRGPAMPAGRAEAVAAPSSPVCYAGEADDGYMGYASRDELAAFLNELLEAERAGARVTQHTAREMDDPGLKSLIIAIQHDEARWCALLSQALKTLQCEASKKVGAFYDKAMAIPDVPQRLVFLNRGQGWVVRKLREMLPKIRDDDLHRDLAEMLASHEHNIGLVEQRISGDKKR